MRLLARVRWPLAGHPQRPHPALLPAFPDSTPSVRRSSTGEGERRTIHLVDEGVDTGPIAAGGSPCAGRRHRGDPGGAILAEEHRLYAEAIRLYAEGRLQVEGRRVRIRSRSLS
jgi:phosphoribosylglycinamide formyltransferase-1